MSWKDKIRNPDCELCPLHESAEHVCLMGWGTRKAEVMIVGEAPGAREDDTAQAFVGPAGQLLDKLLGFAGLERSDCYITNVCKCRPPDNRTPEPAEIKTCVTNYLIQEIEKVNPRWILLLGNSALRGVVGRSGITKHRGSTYELGEATAMATFHPAYALRNPRHLEPLQSDFERFGRLMRGEDSPSQATRVQVVRNKGQLARLRQELMKHPRITFDLETSYDKKRKMFHQPWDEGAGILCASFSWQEGHSVVVPLHHAESPFRSWPKVLRYLKPALERKDAKYNAHNGKFDCRWLAWFGVYVRLDFDTMLAAHILDENRLKGLEPLSQIFFGADPWKMDLTTAYDMPFAKLGRYAGTDTDHTHRLWRIFREQLIAQPRLGRIFARLMMPASNALTKVESIGMWLDEEKATHVLGDLTSKRDKVLKKLKRYVPPYNRETINFNSHPQLAHWLFDELKLPVLDKTKKGAPSSNESVLLRLAKKHPAPALLLEYRSYKGNIEKITSWLENADERGRIHTNYKLFGTVTGRLSSEKPNLQQVPREGIMRTCFGAPDGWVFIEADYSQIELRIAAMLSGDRTMLRAYLTGEDLHLKTASETSGKRPQDVTKEERKKAKAVNFGFLYGMGASKFVDYARDNYDVEVSEAEAHEIRERFFRTYTRLRPWHDRQRRLVHRYERVQSPIGRIRHLPDVRSGDKSVRADAERQGINSPVQSFASDLMLLSLVRLDRELPAREARVVGTVHDALLFEAREGSELKVAKTIKRVMEDMDYVKKLFGAVIDVPIEAEVSIGTNWGAGTVVDL